VNSRVVLFRLSLAEHAQLRTIAEREGDTVSEVIRDALYRRYGIGSVSAASLVAASAHGDCNTPRT
jgi:hypothetical protein